MPLYRPPSEANSLILQVTLGCSHNKCSFCSMYKKKKFEIKSWQEIEAEIEWASRNYPEVKRIFLADGNVLCMNTSDLVGILNKLFTTFPKLERVSSYAGPKDLLDKSITELKTIRQAGLSLLYLGVESGSAKVLEAVNKGVTPEEMIQASQKAIQTGYVLSCTIISGLGGKDLMKEHAIETANIMSVIQPHYLGALTLMLQKGTSLETLARQGKFIVLSPEEVIEEIALMIEHFQLRQTIFRSNHASNYLFIKGTLNEDKQKILTALGEVRHNKNFRGNEAQRRL